MRWQRWLMGLCLCVVYAACSQQPTSGEEQSPEHAIESIQDASLEPVLESSESPAPDASGDESKPEESTATPEPTEQMAEKVLEPAGEPQPESTTEATEPTPPVSKNVDSTGGRVCHEHVCVEISTQAMDKRVLTVIFQSPKQSVPAGSVAPAVDVGPDNWKPKGSMFVIFRNIQVPSGIKPEQLRVAFIENFRWQFVPTTYDNQQKEWLGETTHFSVWGLVASNGSCQSQNDCHDAERCNQGTCQAPSCQTDTNCLANEYCSQNLKVCFKVPPCRSKVELCNSTDDNCNGVPDEGCPFCRTSQECGAKHDCQRGVCVPQCPPDQIVCNDVCVSVYLDTKNCGACGVVCKSTQQCVLGSCVQ